MDHDATEATALLPKEVESKESFRDFKLLPAIFIVFFGWNLSATIIPNHLLLQTCVYKGFDRTVCASAANNNVTLEIEELIQPVVAKILMTISMMNGIVPGVLSLFLGAWSDKFGRKKIICAGYCGHAIALALFSVLSLLIQKSNNISPWIYVLPYIPVVFTGGWPTMIISTLCYVADTTNESNRSVRLAITEMIINVGILSGIASCSFVLRIGHPTTVFIVSTFITTLATFYTMSFVEESVKEPKQAKVCDQIKELISFTAVTEILTTCFKRRPFKSRAIIWSLLMIMVLTVSSTNAGHNVYYLFVREKFQWSLKEASLFDAISLLISIVGSMLALSVLKKMFRFSDIALAKIAIVSFLADCLIRALAQSTRTLYVASFVSLLKFLTLPMCRSLLASVIPRNEIGKIFSFTSSMEAVATLFVSPLYGFTYAKTFTVIAGGFYFITAAMCLINFVLIYTAKRLKETHEDLINQNVNF